MCTATTRSSRSRRVGEEENEGSIGMWIDPENYESSPGSALPRLETTRVPGDKDLNGVPTVTRGEGSDTFLGKGHRVTT